MINSPYGNLLIDEEQAWKFYTFLHIIKVLLLGFLLFFGAELKNVNLDILNAVSLKLNATNVYGWFFISYGLITKNLFQIRMFSLILIFELVFFLASIFESGKYILTSRAIFLIQLYVLIALRFILILD